MQRLGWCWWYLLSLCRWTDPYLWL